MILCAIAFVFMFPVAAHATTDSLYIPKTPAIDRLAVRTNALDWLLTIPNIGIEYDLTSSEFNSMTIGISAKYNWNTYHTYAPPVVFNLMDIRPEFRYWYRTRKPVRGADKWDIQTILKDKKNPKSWRAAYIGAYVDYASYSFKFSKKGIQGYTVGVGASTGYNIPMYEYKNGAIDVELGFSVGLQVATRDVFAHNPNGYSYTKVENGSKGLHFTPFPVVSDVRVAFVWRHKSIKDKIKEDEDKIRLERLYKINEVDYNFDSYTKEWYDSVLADMNPSTRKEIQADEELYRNGFIERLDAEAERLRGNLVTVFPAEDDPRVQGIVQGLIERLDKKVERLRNSALKQFDSERRAQNAEVAKAAAKVAKEAKAQEAEAAKVDGEKADKAEKPAKAEKAEKKTDKAEKVEKEKKAKDGKKEKANDKEKENKQENEESAE